jgi:ornithine decarboxylase
MPQFRSRAAVTPIRRSLDIARLVRPTVDQIVHFERPAEPLHCLRPAVITENARAFRRAFPGEVLYAVKCNPDPVVLRAVWAGGVRHFDCASAAEIALVRNMFPSAAIHFMHPVKSRPAIHTAWRRHGVRDFVLDTADELAKILEETSEGVERGLFVRLAIPKGSAMYDLSGKFGASVDEAADLLRMARPHATRLGVHFHVGSQCAEPEAYARALALAGAAIRRAGVGVDVVDVGGGFPVNYPDMTPPPVGVFTAEIEAGFRSLRLRQGTQLWAEPGRALVASGGSVVVQVQLRRGDALYINDGVYGSLSDAGGPGFRFPVRLIRPEGRDAASPADHEFELFGPTCDSADRMRGPFRLPEDVLEGDWIEIGQLGAYGSALRTAFNGFDGARLVEVSGPPLLETSSHAVEPVPLDQAA